MLSFDRARAVHIMRMTALLGSSFAGSSSRQLKFGLAISRQQVQYLAGGAPLPLTAYSL